VAKQSNSTTVEASAGANLSNRVSEIMRSDSNPRLQERQILVYLTTGIRFGESPR
jgi:hypothetical protein